jgi:hypothetical protein
MLDRAPTDGQRSGPTHRSRAGADWNQPAGTVEPDCAAGKIYNELYRGLYPATRDAAHALAAFSQEPD